ncbi:Hypothetical predicted protein [Octopus vulgaris]|uniref:Uncharacterized protein n=1 Tax=Octopus vulgaris TaxID=6645 RepID=A0AA36BH47_OCTVU|nr:Hypothetical predicted protein [Octopus vulgaris]
MRFLVQFHCGWYLEQVNGFGCHSTSEKRKLYQQHLVGPYMQSKPQSKPLSGLEGPGGHAPYNPESGMGYIDNNQMSMRPHTLQGIHGGDMYDPMKAGYSHVPDGQRYDMLEKCNAGLFNKNDPIQQDGLVKEKKKEKEEEKAKKNMRSINVSL